MSRLYIISGCNGAGKTTASYTMLPDLLNLHTFVNADEIADELSPQEPEKEMIRASRLMIERMDQLIGRGEDFAVETTLATKSLAGMISRAQHKGYMVGIFYFWLKTPELAIKRVAMRGAAGGHNIPDEVVRRRYVMGLNYFFGSYIPVADRWILADNSHSPFTVVAEGSRQIMYIKDSEKYRLIWNIGHPDEEL